MKVNFSGQSSSVCVCRIPTHLPFYNCVRLNYRNVGSLLSLPTSSSQCVQSHFVSTTPSQSSLSFSLLLFLSIYSLSLDQKWKTIVTMSLLSSLAARISESCHWSIWIERHWTSSETFLETSRSNISSFTTRNVMRVWGRKVGKKERQLEIFQRKNSEDGKHSQNRDDYSVCKENGEIKTSWVTFSFLKFYIFHIVRQILPFRYRKWVANLRVFRERWQDFWQAKRVLG